MKSARHPHPWFACGAAAAVLALTSIVSSATAAEPAPPAATEVQRLQTELAQLKDELREQRALILQMMKLEQQHHEVFLRYLQSGQLPPVAAPDAGSQPPPTGDKKETPAPPPVLPARGTGTISGNVRVNGETVADVFVYLDGPRAAPVRNQTLEIKQKDKQFWPRAAVVQLGTRLVFPNVDTIIHNVFSQSPGNAFDLGSIKGGERSSPVVLLKPGHVEMFCNIHARMRADLLVVPNSFFARVAADGSFQLTGVPTGARRIVVWGPRVKTVSQPVEVTLKATAVSLVTDAIPARPHLNKRGEAYGSYDE